MATGTGATGWAASLHLEHHSTIHLPTPEEARLVFFVREPWPSLATGTSLTEGELKEGSALEITSELPESAVLFGDGIEADRLHIDWGQHIRIGLADRHLTLVK